MQSTVTVNGPYGTGSPFWSTAAESTFFTTTRDAESYTLPTVITWAASSVPTVTGFADQDVCPSSSSTNVHTAP